MTLTITGTTMTGDHTAHTARLVPGRQHEWEVSWLPGKTLDGTRAVTAMLLADIAGRGDLLRGHRLSPHIHGWAGEPGLAAHDAITRATQPPRGTSRHQEPDSGQPDREAAG